MNEEQIDDLKQFITVTVLQAEKRLESKITDVRSELTDLRHEMANGFSGVGEAIEHIHNQSDEYSIELDKRLAKIEHQAT